MSSFSKCTTHISLKKHLTSCQEVFHVCESAESWIYCLEHCVHGRKRYKCRFIAIFHISQWVSKICHMLLKCTHVDQCNVRTPHVWGKAPTGLVSMRWQKYPLNHAHPYVVRIYFVILHKHTRVLISTRFSIVNALYAKSMAPKIVCAWNKKVTILHFYDIPCHLVIIWYLVYFTVCVGHPPLGVDILLRWSD